MAGPLGASPGIIVGVGVGTAAAAAIEPAVELPRQKAWSENPVRILDPAVMARLVASGGIALGAAHEDALNEGFSTDKVDALVYLAQTVPGFAEAMTAWRRGTISPDDFAHTLIKTAMDTRYYPAVKDLKDEWLTPPQVALAIVRGLLNDPGLMAVTLDAGPGNVTAYRESTIDALKEALGGGIDTERLRVMVGSIGLPMSTQAAANATFRKIITRSDFNRSILEGDVRPEWADAIFDQSRQYPTAHDYVELRLRGWTDDQGMYDGTALHGMSKADTDILFKINGRPPSPHQVFIGLRRGGVYDGPTGGIDAPILKAMQEANLRPEWYNIIDAGLETLPAAFVLRALTQAHDVTQAESETLLLHQGWPTALAKSVSTKWYDGKTATTTAKKDTVTLLTQEYLAGVLSPAAFTTALGGLGYSAEQAAAMITNADFKASSAERTRNTKLIEKQYVGLSSTESQARSQLATLGWPQGVIDNKIGIWNVEREIQETTLTVAQITKGLSSGALTAQTATPLLQALGEDAAAIQTIIASNPPKAAS